MKKISNEEIKTLLDSQKAEFKDVEFCEDLINSTDPPRYRRFMFNKLAPSKEIGFLKFDNCIFNTEVSFEELNFGGLWIKNSILNSGIYIANCHFNSLFIIDNLTFKGKNKSSLRIHESTFRTISSIDDVQLHHFHITDSKFNDSLFIESCVFFEDCGIEDTDVFDTFTISNTQYKKLVTIKNDFKGKTLFDNIVFTRLKFNPLFLSNRVEFQNCEFQQIALFRDLRLTDRLSFKNIDITNCTFLYSVFEDTLFNNCTFDIKNMIDERLLMQSVRDNELLLDEHGTKNENLLKHSIDDIINQYRMFETNFDKHRDYDRAGEFHKRRFELDKNSNKKTSLRWLLLSIYKLSSDYGENYARSLLWILIVLFSFSILYLYTGILYSNTQIWWWDSTKTYNLICDWGSSFLYSLLSSSPFKRDSEIIRSLGGWTTTLSILETIIQTILGTLFIIGIRRKFKR